MAGRFMRAWLLQLLHTWLHGPAYTLPRFPSCASSSIRSGGALHSPAAHIAPKPKKGGKLGLGVKKLSTPVSLCETLAPFCCAVP